MSRVEDGAHGSYRCHVVGATHASPVGGHTNASCPSHCLKAREYHANTTLPALSFSWYLSSIIAAPLRAASTLTTAYSLTYADLTQPWL